MRVGTATRDLRFVEVAKRHIQVPRVCLYASAMDGQRLEQSLEVLRCFAEFREWATTKAVTDGFPWTTCTARPGWNLVRAEINSGRADGVAVLAESDVSRSPEEYAEQLAWVHGHSAFLVVVRPAAGGGPR